MKKTFLFAALAALCMTSCMNEEFPTLNPSTTGYGYISVNASNDPVIETRADVKDLATWTIETSKAGEAKKTWTSQTKYEAGTYTVYARNYKTESAWMEANDSWGAAYYEGDVDVNVVAGQTTSANIDCGKAQNGRITTSFSLAEVFEDVSITVGVEDRKLVFNEDNKSKLAYFAPGTVSYTLKYKYNKSEEKNIQGTVTVVKGTEHIISVSSDMNGIIKVSVTYDDSFEDGADENIYFDALTGEKV